MHSPRFATARVARALAVHELGERLRDRWVLVISGLFALLAAGASLYGRSAGDVGAALTGPSLVTLVSLLMPLVGLVLGHDAIVGERERNTLGLLLSLPSSRLGVVVGKYVGRLAALVVAGGAGIGAALLAAAPGQASVLGRLLVPTLLLGAAFLSVGFLISSLSRRQATATSVVVAVWFVLVFFYDLGLLALLVASDGGVGAGLIGKLVLANPTGLFRVLMMARFAGPGLLDDLGVDVGVPGAAMAALLWAAWIALPVVLGGLLLGRQKEVR
jgi:Cu-processing system permease protein